MADAPIPTIAEALAALDAHPTHEAALPFLRAWAASDDPIRRRHVVGRVGLPLPGEDEPAPPAPPSLASMALGFGKALVAHVASGLAEVDDAEHARRLAACRGCEMFDAAKTACVRCGCGTIFATITGGLGEKARWKTAACPLGKW